MRNHLLPLPLLSLCGLVLAAGPHWSLAEDPYAFPKYKVSFLNGLPVLNETAERWLASGLKGGEREFLDQSWKEGDEHEYRRGAFQSIDSGDESPEGFTAGLRKRHEEDISSRDSSPYTLQRMQMAGRNSFVCLIPPPVESHVRPIEEPLIEPSPLQTFGLLQPLSNSCIYHRQGWFTYAYCHNNQVRQFREVAHAHPHQGGFVPEEDPEWEAFTLGQAAASSNEPLVGKDQKDLTPGQRESLAGSIDVIRTAGHRYLVQRWGDGTICDKTRRPREIEVQFHCSQDLTDSILFVKETSTCHYIMAIHTPRLCGEPGFRTRLEQREEAPIRCREVLEPPEAVAEATHSDLRESASPSSRRVRKPSRIASVAHHDSKSGGGGAGAATTDGKKVMESDKSKQEMMQEALRVLFGDSAEVVGDNGEAEAFVVSDDDGDFLVDVRFIDADLLENNANELDKAIAEASGTIERLEEILRAAGIEVTHAGEQEDGSNEEQKGGRKEENAGSGRKKPSVKHEEL